MKKSILMQLCLAALLFFASVQVYAYCDPKNISTSSSAVAVTSNSATDISDMLSLSSSYSYTQSSNFAGYQLACWTGGETLYYRNGIDGGYTVKFTSGDLDTYIKFTASLSMTSKSFSGLMGTTYAASDFDADMTLNAEVVSTTTYDATTSSSSMEIPVLYLLTSSGNSTYATASALRSFVATSATASAASYSNLKGFASMTVNFLPVSTTCTIENLEFSLPSTTVFALKSGEYSDSQFTIPVSCSGSVNSLATKTFNLRAYSNDLVDTSNYIIRNSASTSSGIGFQLFNSSTDPIRMSSTFDSSATSLASMTKGSDLVTSLTSIGIGARYKIYDSSNLSPGTVIGTMVIYMEYE
ncbi:fimbrial protein [Pantoea cypripedii]|nr:fimbrial protein [Pantoea cypripedii]